ncbi:hypothetical protein WAI453_002083 [Rhynchosporium graminicola]|uniref:Apple domain-containing protein n=1 Tax=Rhynchosporium graminicola TaxID=2792576 RepID=A0A1E1KWG6_9HELO|nr:uncharacterized protein RCO7_06248 [Rhynchosporium commune]
MSLNTNTVGPRASYHDAPETIRSDQSHNAPETVPSYILPEAIPYHEYYASDKTLKETNPKVMEVSIGMRRRLGDISARRFWLVFGIVCAIVVAASVGGAVGGSLAVRNGKECEVSSALPSARGDSSTNSLSSSSTSTSTSTTTFSSTPTITAFPAPSDACQNGTTYNSLFKTGENGIPSAGTGLTFTRLCGRGAVLTNIGSAFVYSLEDCIEICAGINFWPRNRNCTSVVYRPVGKGRPVNCWAAGKTGVFNDEAELFMGVLQ